MKTQLIGVLTSMVLLATVPTLAHHPFAAEYDRNKPVTLNGTVTKIDWSNPHTVLHVDAKDPRGQKANWAIELGGPNALTRRGWTKASVKTGDQVTVEGWRARDGSTRANANTVIVPDGHKLPAASSFHEKTKTSTH